MIEYSMNIESLYNVDNLKNTNKLKAHRCTPVIEQNYHPFHLQELNIYRRTSNKPYIAVFLVFELRVFPLRPVLQHFQLTRPCQVAPKIRQFKYCFRHFGIKVDALTVSNLSNLD